MLHTKLAILVLLAVGAFGEELQFKDGKEALDAMIPNIMERLFSNSKSFSSSFDAVRNQKLDDPWYHVSCHVCHATINAVESLI